MRTACVALALACVLPAASGARNLLRTGGHSGPLSRGTVTAVDTDTTSCPCGTAQQNADPPRGFETVATVAEARPSGSTAGAVVFEQTVKAGLQSP